MSNRAIGMRFYFEFPEPGTIGVSVGDEGTEGWRRLTAEEKDGSISLAIDAFIQSLVDSGEVERVHTEPGESFYWAERAVDGDA